MYLYFARKNTDEFKLLVSPRAFASMFETISWRRRRRYRFEVYLL